MNKVKSVKKNYVYNLIYQIVLLIVPLIVTPYISRVLSPEGIGKYSFSNSLITYFIIFGSLGFIYYAQREIAKHSESSKDQSIIFWEIIICRSLSVAISLIVNIILIFCNVYGDYTIFMALFNINIIAILFDISFFYQGNEEFGKMVFMNVFIKLCSLISIFIFVKDASDVHIYALINSIMVIVSNLVLWIYLPKYLEKTNIKELHPLKHLKPTIKLFIPTIATTIYTVLDKTLIGLLVEGNYTVIENGVEVVIKISNLENGYYEQSEKIVKMIMTIITCFGIVMIPRNTKEISTGHIENVKTNIHNTGILLMLIGIPMMFGLMSVSDNLVFWFLGEKFEKCGLLIKVLSPLIIIIGFSNLLGLQFMVPCGKDRNFAIALLVGTFSNLIFNLIFIPRFWSLGAALGTIISELLVTVTMIMMNFKEINFKEFILPFFKYFILGLIMFISLHYIGNLFDYSLLSTFVIVIIGVIIYIFELMITKDKILAFIINKLKNKLKHID